MAKPIYVMRFRSSMNDTQFTEVKDLLFKSDIVNDYHILILKNNIDKDEFEMYNADKIERQEWNELVNKIMK